MQTCNFCPPNTHTNGFLIGATASGLNVLPLSWAGKAAQVGVFRAP